LLHHQSLAFLSFDFTSPAPIISDSKRFKRLNDVSADLFTPPIPQSGTSKIVYVSNQDGSMQIYAMNADGSGQYRLTYSGANDVCPRWSSSGTKILFESDRDNPTTGYMDIYVMNADGTGLTRLTTDPNDDSWASWSSDGNHIAFHSNRNGMTYQVYSMNADGSNQLNLSNSAFSDGDPSYSPDGSKIAFASDRDHTGYDSVYVMNSTGTNQHRITFSADNVSDNEPVWSRDGNKIAFVSTRDSTTETWQETDDNGTVITKSRVNKNKEIYLMNADGSGQTRLTTNLANEDSPNWSPDGSKIVFSSDRDRDNSDPIPQVWAMNPDGSGQIDLSNTQTGNYAGSWASGSGNQPPIASGGGPYSGIVSQNVSFNGTGSFDPDGSIASYSWNFGDGGNGSGSSPTHAYSSAGTYTVTLTVTDSLGAQGSTTTSVSVSSSSSDAYANNFLLYSLGRSPHGDESSYWTDIMRAAYPQGQPPMLMAMREFGITVFESQEYANRGRSNHDYVYDLYKTYLMRDPDLDGWNFWTGVCDSYGREAVRQAFDDCSEFHGIVASLTASGSPSSNVASLATAQVDPFNQSGNQVEARDCEWNLPLVSLPGRAGLDLGLSVSYSSLVWTKSGPYVYFDQDYESLSPGFTIGFPTVQWRKFDAQTGRNVYVLAGGGRHTELRQVGTSNVYESADSSYMQLTDNGSSLLLRTTDGTQISFSSFLVGYSVTGIEDRNGNFITVENDWRGDIQHVTDTLGRVINFIYDGNANLIRIEQAWAGEPQPHVWATFGWDTKAISASFTSQVVGTFNGETMPVVTQIALDDGSRYNFEYNGSMQASFIRRYTFDPLINDYGQRSYTAYDYQGTDDCPRIFRSRVWAQSWNGDNGVPGEVVTQFLDPGDGSRLMIAPDQTTVYKEFYGSSWQHGLVTSTQVSFGSTVQKTTTNSWTQDVPTGINYQTNPRVYETNITDGTNHRRTTVGYQTFNFPSPSGASCSLPNEVYEYDSDQTTVLRRTHTDYKLDSDYLNRRIIGLPQAKLVYQGASALMAKTTYLYDWNGDYLQGLPSAPTQHDSSYSTDFYVGRGNLVDVQRWDVNYPTDRTKITENKIAYNIDGSIIYTLDGMNHKSSISYADSFAGTYSGQSTYAYPSTLTDADQFDSTIQYNYSYGAKTQVQGPPPQNQPNGIIQTFQYDNAARLQRVTTTNTGAYARYYYGPYYVQSWSSVNTVADEAYSVQTFDGLGRPIGKAANHPGSTGGYSAQLTKYDLMGRAIKQSNPTEIDGGWNPVGDDQYNAQADTGGYRYAQQSYDWKGRPRVTTHPDGTYNEAIYNGCGCAGGEIVTLSDEGTVVNGQTVVRRQNIYSDALGRRWKTEVLNFDGSVYSTAETTLDARDQATLARQFSGTDQSGVYQDTTMSYDGYGRLLTKHSPEQQDQSGNPTHATYAYNPDDTVHQVSDARGASATYTYNNGRHLINEIDYNAPSGVTPTSNVSFGYDAAGNRTSMTDGLGSQSYSYDSLSRLTSETRTFSGLGAYTLGYSYNLADELVSVTDPFGAQVAYNRDNVGRVSSVTGSGFLGNVSYALNIQYRAWDGQKSVTYGDGNAAAVSYDARMHPASYLMPGLREQYQYYADGRLQQMTDLDDRGQDPGNPDTARHFSRVQSYDHAGRLTNSSGVPGLPYVQSYAYDAFDNTTSRSGYYYYQGYTSDGGTFQNNRRQDISYDADGNVQHTPTYVYAGGPVASFRDWTYDAAGDMTQVRETLTANNSVSTYVSGYDGDGQLALEYYQENANASKSYMVRSSVMNGQVVTRLDYLGNKSTTSFTIDGQLTAVQFGGASPSLRWQHIDPLSLSEAGDTKPVYDPLGNYVVWQHAPTGPPPNAYPPSAAWAGGIGPSFGYAINSACNLNGIPTDCDLALNMLAHGSAALCPNNDCGPIHVDGGWVIPNGSGAWISNGSRSYWLDPDTPVAPQGKKNRKPPTLKKVHRTQQQIEAAKNRNAGVGKDEIEALDPAVIDLVNTTLSSQPCIDFFTAILGGVSSGGNPVLSTDLRQVFQDFLNQPKKHQLLTRQMPAGSWGYGNPIGNIKASTAAIYSPSTAGDTVIADATAIISELFHLAGSRQIYRDQDLASAAQKSGYAAQLQNYVTNPDLILDNIPPSQRTPGDYSINFHYLQYNICNVTPGSPHMIR
jgi:YD repeat-containing protein